jgi:hypothetical protein
MDISVVLDIWETVVDYIPASKREDVANKVVRVFSEQGLDHDDFLEIKGEDSYIDTAIDNFYEQDTEEDEVDYDAVDFDEAE